MFGKSISCQVGAAEALGIRQVSVAEDASLAVVFVELIFSDSLKSRRRRCARFEEIFVLQRNVAVCVYAVGGIVVAGIVLVVIAV